jgi:hypothetical protein
MSATDSRPYNGKPHLVVSCSCGNGLALELGIGKRIPYTGMKSARILANLFRHFHKEHGEVTEEIVNPRKDAICSKA